MGQASGQKSGGIPLFLPCVHHCTAGHVQCEQLDGAGDVCIPLDYRVLTGLNYSEHLRRAPAFLFHRDRSYWS